MFDFGPLDRGRRRRRLEPRQRYFDQSLDHVGPPDDRNSQARQQRKAEHCLNKDDRGERISALPRPHSSFTFGVSGHVSPLSLA
jgi:hypothetical protein